MSSTSTQRLGATPSRAATRRSMRASGFGPQRAEHRHVLDRDHAVEAARAGRARRARASRRRAARWSGRTCGPRRRASAARSCALVRSRSSRPGRRCVSSQEVRRRARRGGAPARAASRRSAASSCWRSASASSSADAEVRRRCSRRSRRASRRTPRGWRRAACCRGRTARPGATRASALLEPRADHRAVGLLGQHLEQHRVRHAAVDDVDGVDAVLRRVERRLDLRQHAAARSCRRRTARRSRARVRSVSSLPDLSSTPGMLVSIISFSAFSTSASLPATTSALML